MLKAPPPASAPAFRTARGDDRRGLTNKCVVKQATINIRRPHLEYLTANIEITACDIVQEKLIVKM
jgi:hypothetical protein